MKEVVSKMGKIGMGASSGIRARRMKDRAEKDLEERLRDEDHQSLRLWLRMLSGTNLIVSFLRSRLKEDFSISMACFEFLAQLERHPEGLRIGEVSRRMMVSSGNATNIADRLEAEGLIVREANAEDRRSVKVRLTSLGQRVFKEIAQVHEGWVVELFEGLSEEERYELYRLLGKLKGHVRRITNGAPEKKG